MAWQVSEKKNEEGSADIEKLWKNKRILEKKTLFFFSLN